MSQYRVASSASLNSRNNKRFRSTKSSVGAAASSTSSSSENARNSTPRKRSRIAKSSPAPMYPVSRVRGSASPATPLRQSHRRSRGTPLQSNRAHGGTPLKSSRSGGGTPSKASRGTPEPNSGLRVRKRTTDIVRSGRGSLSKKGKKRRTSLSTLFLSGVINTVSEDVTDALCTTPEASPQKRGVSSPLSIDLSPLMCKPSMGKVDQVDSDEDGEQWTDASNAIPDTQEEAIAREVDMGSSSSSSSSTAANKGRKSLLRRAGKIRRSLSGKADLQRVLAGLDERGDVEDDGADSSETIQRQFISNLFSDDFAPLMVLIDACDGANECSKAHNAIAQLFGSEHSSSILDLLKHVITQEISSTMDVNTLFRGGSTATRLISAMLRTVGEEFAHRVLVPTIDEVDSDGTMLEVNPARVVLHGAQGSLPLEDQEKLKQHEARLAANRIAQLTRELLDRIIASVAFVPDALRAILMMVASGVEQKFPEMLHRSIGGIMFLRWLCPLLTQPHKLPRYAADGLQHPHASAKTLILICKVMQNISNEVRFGEKEPYMAPFNVLPEQYGEKLRVLFDKLLTGTVETMLCASSDATPHHGGEDESECCRDGDTTREELKEVNHRKDLHNPIGGGVGHSSTSDAVHALAQLTTTHVATQPCDERCDAQARERLCAIARKLQEDAASKAAGHTMKEMVVNKILESPRKAARRSSLGVSSLRMTSPRHAKTSSKAIRRGRADDIIRSATASGEFQRPMPQTTKATAHPDTPRPKTFARVY